MSIARAKRFVPFHAFALGAALFLFASGPSAPALGADLPVVEFGLPSGGVFGLGGQYMIDKKLDRKHGFVANPRWGGVANVERLIAIGAIPVGLATAESALRANLKGIPLKLVQPYMRTSHNYFLVRKDSPYKDLMELRGKPIALTREVTSLYNLFDFVMRKQGVSIEKDFQLKKLVAAGYVLYGASTVLVYTVGSGVHGFTLDRGVGEFLLSHEDVRCPERGTVYSANVGRHKDWEPGVRKFLDHVTDRDEASGRPHSLRYSGALVADLHRCLLDGGVYFYPADPGNRNGKLRLLYECAPLACVAEQAGGAASTGRGRLLDVAPESIHQRTPVAIGSAGNVALYERFLAEG